ncbi:helix-turn-helix transcriptional regulator [Trinickia mobilis]|uniref:helix-turn-helix transcriptional regulator n=1 Tax=Trinickia mobilis TaxID=2816356 RepID=UPI001A8CC84E|nr:WYL domain-containing protein [Trinickia mobilis]
MGKHDSEIIAVLPTEGPGVEGMSTPQVRDALARAGLPFRYDKAALRGLQALENQGLVYCESRGRALYWKKRAGASGMAAKAGAMMRFDEALALQVLKRFSSRQIPVLVAQSLSGMFEVAEDKLARAHAATQEHHGKWLSKVAVEPGAFPLEHPTIEPEVFAAVSQALFHERKLHVQYRKRGDESDSERILLPLGLVEVGGLVYLVGGTEGKRDPTLYRLDRMAAAVLQDESFTYPRTFSLDDYVKHQRQFDFFPNGQIRLRLRFRDGAGDHLLESRLSDDQKVERTGDVLEVTGTVMLSQRLRWWIRSFGPQVEVIEPSELRDELAQEARALHDLYRRRRV